MQIGETQLRRCGFGIGLISLLLGAAPAAAAQPAAPEPQEEEIVVTGQRLQEREAARRIVHRIAVATNGQLARFALPVCPEVIGVAAAEAGMIADRVREVAREVGAPVGETGCASNFFLVIVPDGRAFVRELHRTGARRFEGLSREALRRLMEESGPARSWSLTVQLDGEGRIPQPAPASASGSVMNWGYNSAAPQIGGGIAVMRGRRSSFYDPSTQQAIAHSFVVLENAAVLGKDVLQIADYAAMRGLAVTSPDVAGVQGTILSLFEPGAEPPPTRLTTFDRGYLRGLYEGSATRGSRSQRSSIISAMTAEAERPGR